MKVRPRRVLRRCLKKTGPGEEERTATARPRSRGKKATRAAAGFGAEHEGLEINRAESDGGDGIDAVYAEDGAGDHVEAQGIEQAEEHGEAEQAALGRAAEDVPGGEAHELRVDAGEIEHEAPDGDDEDVDPRIGPEHVEDGEAAREEPGEELVRDEGGKESGRDEDRVDEGCQLGLEAERAQEHG